MEPVTALLATLMACLCLYYFIANTLLYFKRLKIPHVLPIPLLGNLGPFILRRISLAEIICNTYRLFPDAKYFGFYDFTTPIYVLRDLDLINLITIKNFDHFCNHRNFVNENLEPIAGRNLFGLRNDQWRATRRHLSPTFTSNKIKLMFGLVCKCAENFANFIAAEAGSTGKTYNMKDIQCRFANDVVASCAFGIDVDSFNEPNNEFFLLGQKTMNFNGALTYKMLISRNFPNLANLLRIKFFESKTENFFKQIISDSVRFRREKGVVRPDVIHLMMESKDADGEPLFDVEEMAAQALVFFLAGFDSISTSMSYLAHEVAINPDVQNKLLAEIENVLEETNGKPTYETICGMRYMDAVVSESMRLHPLVSSLDRVCVKEFELPPATPDSEPVTLKPGDVVWFQSYAIHRDSKYYPRPNDFVPERFLNGEVNSSSYMPFGIGPRICIANRFALMEMKVMLFHMLQHCIFEPDVKTRIPMILDKKSFMVMADGGFWLRLRARKY
ncbi:hypothetical protein DMN91_009367 [Ooceraea biroi]|uniref:Cytochrome P450 9e2 n=1 Tax=Ooceraea biroi TaxID=2015173 RepID=A0A026W075_OOCBI|nr:cytochrome P450 9e2 [Ooceraea biroi]EZA49458.1 Cytochrome P450 9e2 [Ooceraea biroi]RLU19009.1 hypothetical protein DMN91_009367 [Ooceraea biroi]